MSALAETVARYLEIRRSLGFKLELAARLLPDFAAYADDREAKFVTRDLCLDWARYPANGSPLYWSTRMATVRIFARYVHAEDPRHEVPSPDLLRHRVQRGVPVLFSEGEIAKVLRCARRTLSPYRAAIYSTLFGLLGASGMRVGEAIRLRREEIDWNQQVLIIRNSKFRKSREVILHRSVVAALRKYAKLRDEVHPSPKSPTFFLSCAGKMIIGTEPPRLFRQLTQAAGVHSGRPHDLRHSFAVRTLLRWYRTGVDVDAWMPRLSTYLGHATPKSTYWYLTASPELLAITRDKLERLGSSA
jgi:integrase/recombinase XerD